MWTSPRWVVAVVVMSEGGWMAMMHNGRLSCNQKTGPPKNKEIGERRTTKTHITRGRPTQTRRGPLKTEEENPSKKRTNRETQVYCICPSLPCPPPPLSALPMPSVPKDVTNITNGGGGIGETEKREKRGKRKKKRSECSRKSVVR